MTKLQAAIENVETFIEEELECRERSMGPPTFEESKYISSAKAALRNIRLIKKTVGA